MAGDAQNVGMKLPMHEPSPRECSLDFVGPYTPTVGMIARKQHSSSCQAFASPTPGFHPWLPGTVTHRGSQHSPPFKIHSQSPTTNFPLSFPGIFSAIQSTLTVSMDDTPRHTRPQMRSRRPRRVKTFTGCMTCRSRHLKCDEKRPGCRRCADAQLDCSGYPGYRAAVQWKPVRGLSDFGICQTEPPESAPVASVTWHASRAQQCSPTPSQDDSVVSDPPHHPQDTESSSRLQPASTHGSPQIPVGQRQSVSPANNYSFPPASRLSRLPLGSQDVLESVGPAHEGDGSGTGTTPCSFPRLVSSPVSPGLSPHFHGTQRHIDLAPSTHLQRRCIEHWVNHLSDALSSVPGSMNPLKRFFMPIAFVGAMSPVSSYTGSAALFYLICSASAFHLAGRVADSQESSSYMTLGLAHQNRGIRHLQHNLVRDDPDQRESVLASLLMCLTYVPVTVERDFWLTHLRGASQWLQRTHVTSWAHSESTVVMYQMLASTATMLRSQIVSESVAHDENFHFQLATMSEPYHLHHIFGLPKVCLCAISDMIAMAVRTRRQNPAITVDLDRLETELYLSLTCDEDGAEPLEPVLECARIVPQTSTPICIIAAGRRPSSTHKDDRNDHEHQHRTQLEAGSPEFFLGIAQYPKDIEQYDDGEEAAIQTPVDVSLSQYRIVIAHTVSSSGNVVAHDKTYVQAVANPNDGSTKRMAYM